MKNLNEQREKYLKDRVDDQIGWYDRKSGTNKKWFYRCRSLVIISGALIPLMVGYADENMAFFKYIAGFLGVVVVVSEGVLSLKKYRENWSIYRMTAERLKREKLLFENGIGEDYGSGDEKAFRSFVVRAEQIMASENEEWVALLEEVKKQEENG